MEYEWKQDLTSTIPGSNCMRNGSDGPVVCSFEWDLPNLFFACFPDETRSDIWFWRALNKFW